MECPKCNSTQSKVVDSGHTDELNAIRRRRECENCRTRFIISEHIEVSQFIVVKKGGTREQFSREKILDGLVRSCEKQPARHRQLEDIINKVEWQLRDEGHAGVSPQDIGEHVIDLLMHVDQILYVRSTLVYKEFKDVDQLLTSVQGILSKNKRGDA